MLANNYLRTLRNISCKIKKAELTVGVILTTIQLFSVIGLSRLSLLKIIKPLALFLCLAPAPSFSSVSVHQDLPIHEGESKRRQNVAGPATLVDAPTVTRRKAQGANLRICFADQATYAFLVTTSLVVRSH